MQWSTAQAGFIRVNTQKGRTVISSEISGERPESEPEVDTLFGVSKPGRALYDPVRDTVKHKSNNTP